jgi:hypothetical protein
MSQNVFKILAEDGEYSENVEGSGYINELSISANSVFIAAGSATITARPPNNDVFHDVPDGVIDLTDPRMVRFEGTVTELKVVVAGYTGGAGQLKVSLTTYGCEENG